MMLRKLFAGSIRLLLLLLCACSSSAVVAQQVLWRLKTGDKIFSSPLVSGNWLYIGSGDHHVYALDRQSGTRKWQFKTGGPVHSSPAVAGDLLLIGSADGHLYALQKNDGRVAWKFASGGEKVYDIWDYYLSSPVVAGDTVYWGSGDGNVYALEAQTGKLIWQFTTGDVVHADAALAGNNLYIGSFDGFFYCLDKRTGALIWKFDTIGDLYFPKGEVPKAALVKNGVVYFGSRDYNIYALDSATGKGRWNMREKFSWVVATPLFYQDNVYFGTSDTHAFYALGAGYGEDRWKLNLNMRVYGSAVVHDSLIYFGCFNGKLYGVSPHTGTIRFEFQTDGSKANYADVFDQGGAFKKNFQLYGDNFLQSEQRILRLGSIAGTPVVADNIIYFGSSDGTVYAVPLNGKK